MKENFREIYDDIDKNKIYFSKEKYNNLSFRIRLLRVFIRYLVRFFGVKSSEIVLTILSKLSSKDSPSYFGYLMYLNLFRISFLKNLSLNNVYESLNIKKDWAKYVIKNSLSNASIANSNFYLKIINNHSPKIKYEVNETKKKFYIYGPGAARNPSKKYSDYTIIHLKPFPEKKEEFDDEILFLNSFYFSNVVEGNSRMIDSLSKRYNSIYVSCMTSILPDGFERVYLTNSGYIASEMALQRILGFLLKKFGKFDCVIDGFNFYLDKDAYKNNNYHKLTRDKKGMIKEKELCLSLADHDFLFNFLITKYYIRQINLIDSHEFKKIIDLDNEVYLEKLFKVRDFSSLKKL